MACSPEKSRLIGDFAAGHVSEADAQLLLDHLETCPECSAEFDLVADLVAASQKAGDGFLVPRREGLILRLILGSAAAAVLIAAVWWIAARWEDHRPRLNALAMVEPPPVADTLLRSNQPLGENATFKAAMEHYARADYAAASKALEGIVENEPSNVLALLYLGISRLQTGEAARAVSPLKQSADLGKDLLQERALWYLGNAYLMINEGGKAIDTFSVLEKLEGDYELNAREIIVKIREVLEE